MKKRDYFEIFFICFIPRFIISLRTFPMIYVSDETSALAIAANLAGNNWNDVQVQAGYYGFGFFSFLWSVFKWVQSPIWLYRIVMSILSFINALVGPICFHILTTFFENIERVTKIIISILCGCLTILNTAVISIKNEEILNLVVWIIVYLLCEILSEKEEKKKIKFELGLLVVLGYSLTLHARSIALYIGVVVAASLYYIFYKKKLMHTFFYIVMLGEYIIVDKLVELYQASIWSGNVRNSSVSDSVSASLSKLSITEETLQGLFMIVGGQVYTATVFTGGVFLIGIVIICIYILGIKKYRLEQEDRYVLVIGGMFLACTAMAIGGQALTWLPGVIKGLTEGTYKSAYRGFTYMRYFGLFFPPVVMSSLIVANIHNKIMKPSVKISIFITGILTLFWINVVLPHIENKFNTFFSTLSGMKTGMEVTRDDWLRGSVLMFVFLASWLWVTYHNKLNYLLIALTIFLIMERVYIFESSTYISQQRNYKKADAGYELLKDISNMLETEDIYVFDDSKATDHQIFYLYQFMNNSLHIIPELPEEIQENTIIFSNKNICEVLNKKAYWAKLDNNEYVYCFGKKNIEIIENTGIELNY